VVVVPPVRITPHKVRFIVNVIFAA